MNRSGRRVVVAVGALLSGACAPLQQAPLVYSSKVAVGIDLSSNSTENPGISITLGVKTIDAAYVPVAVSKEADPNSPAGAASTPGILLVHAQYGQGSTGRDAQQLTDENKLKINNYIDARKAATDAAKLQKAESDSVDGLKGQLAAISSAIKSIDTLGVAPPQLPAAAAMGPASAAEAQSAFKSKVDYREDVIQNKLNPQLLAISNPPPVATVPPGTQDLTTVRAALQVVLGSTTASLQVHVPALADAATDAAAKNAKADDLFSQAAQAASLLQTKKTDAMSVFGRFDSDSSALAPLSGASGASTGLFVGKVFSTGLASQNLTEATKIAAIAACISNALVAVGAASAASAGDRSAMITALSSACSATPAK